MNYKLFFLFVLLPYSAISQWNPLGNIIEGEADGGDLFGWSTDINSDGNIIIVGDNWNSNNGSFAGLASVYFWDGVNWIQKGENIEGDLENDFFGEEVAIDSVGNRIAIGAVNGDNSTSGLNAGTVKIYDWDGTSWNQLGSTLEGIGDPILGSDYFGNALSFSSNGNILVIGSPFSNTVNGISSGLAKIFQWDGTDWIQMGSDILGPQNRDDFGWSIDINNAGTVVAIGAKASFPFGPNSNGLVQVYGWNGTEWIQRGSTLDGEAEGDEYGRSVSLDASGNILAVGASGHETPDNVDCNVYVYEWSGTDWIQKGNTLTTGDAADSFGRSISLSANGNLLAVGHGSFLTPGFVSIFEWVDTAWELQQTLAGQESQGVFGADVSFNALGNTILVGAWGAQETGTVQVYNNETITNIQELTFFEIDVYPNPTLDKIYISCDEEIKYMSLYDLAGKALINFKVSNNEFSIALKEYDTGIYFLKIESQNQVKTVKLVKF